MALNGSGDRLAVGAIEDDGSSNGNSNAGSVRLFTFDDNSFTNPTQVGNIGYGYTGSQSLDLSSGNAPISNGDNFGSSLSFNSTGERLAIGATSDDGYNDTGASGMGAVRLFSFSDTSFGSPALIATIGGAYTTGVSAKNIDITSTLGADDNFGQSVALNDTGDRLAVGSHYNDGLNDADTNSGAVHLFTFSDSSFSGGNHIGSIGANYTGANSLNLSQQLGDNDLFGISVSLNGTGDRLIVGAKQDDGLANAASNSGAIYAFSFGDTSFGSPSLSATFGNKYHGGTNLNIGDTLEPNDEFGRSASLNSDGTRLAVGAFHDHGFNNPGSDYGATYLFTFSDSSFGGATLSGIIGNGYTGGNNINLNNYLRTDDYFGLSVALNDAGDRLAVGAANALTATGTGTDIGSVFLFSFADNNFTDGMLEGIIGSGYTEGKSYDLSLKLDDDDRFGSSVTFNGSGTQLAVGARFDDGASDDQHDSGAVYLFTFSDTDFNNANLIGTIQRGGDSLDFNSQLSVSKTFGDGVSLSSDGLLLAVGAKNDDDATSPTSDAGRNYGAVFLFTLGSDFSSVNHVGTIGVGYTGSESYDMTGTLEAQDWFGRSVSLDDAGSLLAVGADMDDGSTNALANSGAVYLFSFGSNFTSPTLQGTIGSGYSTGKNYNLTLGADDRFGKSVSLSGDGTQLVAGAPLDYGGANLANESGTTYLFTFGDTSFSSPTLIGNIGSDYPDVGDLNLGGMVESGDQFGTSVSLNSAGDRMAVGASADDGFAESNFQAGAVHLFSFNGSDFSGAELTATLGSGYTGGKNLNLSSTLGSEDFFGHGVALNGNGDQLAVGAAGDDGFSNTRINSGAVYLFTFSDTDFSSPTLVGTIGHNYSGTKDINLNDPVSTILHGSDNFGSSVSLSDDAHLLVVGAPADDGLGQDNANNYGAVYLITFSDINFSGGDHVGLIGVGYTGSKDLKLDGDLPGIFLSDGDNLGNSVSLSGSGTLLAIGAPKDDGWNGTIQDVGAVHLVSFGDKFSSPTLRASLGYDYANLAKSINLSSTTAAYDYFGSAVALNGDGTKLAVTAPGDDGQIATSGDYGAAHLFTFSDSNFSNGSLDATLGKDYTGGNNLAISLASSEQFGQSGISYNATGNQLAISARYSDGFSSSSNDSGSVYLFSATEQATAVASYSYSDNPTETSRLQTSALKALLDAGTDVTLQASNDITLEQDLTVDNGSGDGGFLYLQAGRSVLLNGSITTDNGRLAIVANDNASSDVVDANRDSGSATITMAAGTSITAGTGEVSFELFEGAGNTYSDSGDISLQAVSGKTIQIINKGPTAGSGIILNGILTSSAEVQDNYGILLVGDEFTNNVGSGAFSVGGGYRYLVWTENPASNNLNSLSYDFKQYNANYATYQFNFLGDGPGVYVQDAGSGFLYTLAPSITANLTGSASKSYDGTTTASITGAGYTTSGGAVDGDSANITAATIDSAGFDTKNVGTSKTVTANISGLTISGSNGGVTVYGYQGPSSTSGVIGIITQRDVSVNNATADSKVYDGLTTASINSAGTLTGLQNGETLTLNSGSASFANKNVGSGKTVSFSGFSISDGTGLASNYNFTGVVDYTSGIITQRAVSVNNATADSKVYDGLTTATINSAGTLTGLQNGETLTLNSGSASFANKNVGTGKTVSFSGFSISDGTGLASNYNFTGVADYSSGIITQRDVSVNNATADSKVYDGLTTAAINSAGTLTGLQNGETLTLNSGSASFANKNVGTGKTVSFSGFSISDGSGLASNYNFTGVADYTSGIITQRAVSVNNATADSKVYDGLTTATINSAGTLTGLQNGETLTLNSGSGSASFANKNVGTGKTVSFSGFSISDGTGLASNYNFTGVADYSSGIITPLAITGNGITASDKVYDGSVTASLNKAGAGLVGAIGGDDVAIDTSGATGAFADKHVGVNKSVTISGLSLSGSDASNYTISDNSGAAADITRLGISAININASDRVYDATTSANIDTGSAALSGKVSGDDLALNVASASGSFADKHVATNKAITISGLALTGSDAGNYTVTDNSNATASISALGITAINITANDKVYDGNTTASLNTGSATLSGALGGDNVSLDLTSISASFADKHVGTAKSVSIGGLGLSGSDSGNYTITDNSNASADVTPLTINAISITASDKVYDASTTAVLNTTSANLSGQILSDDVTLNSDAASGQFADKHAGANKAVTISGLTLTGADASNYNVIDNSGATASISKLAIQSINITASNKVYDGNTTASLNTGSADLSGTLGGDDVSLDTGSISGLFANKNAGNSKSITIGGLLLKGADSNNYRVTDNSGASADITPLGITATGITAADKVYNANTVAIINTGAAALSGEVSGDDVTLNVNSASGSFADKQVGTDKAVTINGLLLTGADAGNYSISDNSGATADISHLGITSSGITAQDKAYDATRVASIDTSGATLNGVLSGDLVTLNTTSASGQFADKNIGTNKPVTILGLSLTGSDAGNYRVSDNSGATADITTATGTVITTSGIIAQDKVYDGTTSAQINTGGFSFFGAIGGMMSLRMLRVPQVILPISMWVKIKPSPSAASPSPERMPVTTALSKVVAPPQISLPVPSLPAA